MFAPKRIICLALILTLFGLGSAPHTGLALAQWSTPVRISEPGGCLYPQILAQGDTLHVVYSNTRGGEKISYVKSIDGGRSWSPHSVLSDTINTNPNQFPRIMALGSSLIAVWRVNFIQGFRRENIGYSISQDNGEGWSAPQYILEANWDRIYSMAAANNGAIINVIFQSYFNPDLIYFNARSTDFGQIWAEPVEVFRVANSNRLDVAMADSIVYFTWSGRLNTGDTWEVYYTRSLDWGLRWTENAPLSDTDSYISNYPAIAVDEAGDPAVSWWDFKYSPYPTTGDILSRQSFDSGQNWSPEEQVTFEHFANGSDITWADDTLHVAWQDERFENSTIFYVSSPDSLHDWTEEYRLEDDPDESDMPAVTASNGRVFVIWVDSREDGGIYFTRFPDFPDAALEDEIPDRFEGLRAYANPFNSVISISYSLQEEKGGKLDIYNIQGQKMKTYNLSGKEGQIEWDARDAMGNKACSGIYFARMRTPSSSISIKLIYLK